VGPSRTDAPHAARRDEPAAARAVLLHQHRFTCDPAGLHVVACSTSVTCSTFLLLQHILHLQHVFTCDPPTLHVLPAVLHRSRHPPSCASYRPSCDCSTCGPPTSACCTCMAPAFCFPRHLLSARAHSGTCKHGAARHNPLLRMRLPLRPAPDAPRPLHLRHRGLVSAAVLHAERWRGRAGGGRRYVCMLDEPASER